MQILSLRLVEFRSFANTIGGLLDMATREIRNKVAIAKSVIDRANVTYFTKNGELISKEKLAELALEYFANHYNSKNVAELKLSHKK